MSCEALWHTVRHAEDDRHEYAHKHTHTYSLTHTDICPQRSQSSPTPTYSTQTQTVCRKKVWYTITSTHTHDIRCYSSIPTAGHKNWKTQTNKNTAQPSTNPCMNLSHPPHLHPSISPFHMKTKTNTWRTVPVTEGWRLRWRQRSSFIPLPSNTVPL